MRFRRACGLRPKRSWLRAWRPQAMLWCLEALGEEVEALFPLSQYEHSAAAAVEYGGQTIGLDVCLCFCRCLRHGLRIVPSFFPCFCLRVIVVSNLFFLVFRSCVLSQNLVLGSYLKLVFLEGTAQEWPRT